MGQSLDNAGLSLSPSERANAFSPQRQRRGGQVVVEALRIHGADTVFCVPGESYLPVLDALQDEPSIRVVSCRHEGGAAFMAEAYGKLKGRPGVLLVTRGPGACNATIGLHTAYQDSTPVVALIGDVDREFEDREAFQEIDFKAFLKPVCKWVGRIQSADRIPEMMSRAFYAATSGRPGPVALIVPEDMLNDFTSASDTKEFTFVQPAPASSHVDQFARVLSQASKPIILAGGGGWTKEATILLQEFAERHNIPVAATFRCQDRIDNSSRCYVGDVGIGISAKLSRRVSESNLVIVLGARLGEKTTQHYELLTPPTARQPLIHVHPDASELGRVFNPHLAICSSVENFLIACRSMELHQNEPFTEWCSILRTEYESHLGPISPLEGSEVDMWQIMRHLQDALPDDAILTTDAGSFSGWMQRFFRYRCYPSQLGATNGAMGYGIPSAIAAQMLFPNRRVVCFCGDGGALMTGNELATAVKYHVNPIILVLNNNMYGSIRVHQERAFPGRVGDTDLLNPSFEAWARTFGAFGAIVDRTEEFPRIFEEAVRSNKPAVIEIKLPENSGPPGRSLTEIRSAALAMRGWN
jgi:acetolactate synthase I/II/III large subunit